MNVKLRTMLARLPDFVKMFPLSRAQIVRLYAAFNLEYTAYPDGDGPLFQLVWQDILNPQGGKV